MRRSQDNLVVRQSYDPDTVARVSDDDLKNHVARMSNADLENVARMSNAELENVVARMSSPDLENQLPSQKAGKADAQKSGSCMCTMLIVLVLLAVGVVVWHFLYGFGTPDDTGDEESEDEPPVVGPDGKTAMSFKSVLKKIKSCKKLSGVVSSDFTALAKDKKFLAKAAGILYKRFTDDGKVTVGVNNLDRVSPLYEIILSTKLKHTWIALSLGRGKVRDGLANVIKYDKNHQLTKNKLQAYLRGGLLSLSQPGRPSAKESADSSKLTKYYWGELEAGRGDAFDYNIVHADKIPKKG